MKRVKMPLALAAVFLWIGFVSAISFMEAWLKFRAPGITLPLGLGIGRLVFNALNKAEWIFAIAILLNIILSKSYSLHTLSLCFAIPLFILLLQTFWLLPVLDNRAEQLIQGKKILSSGLHFYYVGMEIIKVACLSVYGFSQFKKSIPS